MMVRDEAENLERCLRSLKRFVDEIVVVDTGSVDDTVKIAKHFGARVYHHPWQNDFSLHRNQSISYAKGRWIMIVDADAEVFFSPVVTPAQCRSFLNGVAGKYPAGTILLKDIQKGIATMQFNTTRFFRKGAVKYEGIVHNQPKVNGFSVFLSHLFIQHYGYDMTQEQRDKKFTRTHSLLVKQIEEGLLTDGLPYFYICQLLAENGHSKEAVEWGEKYLELYENGGVKESALNITIYFTLVRECMKCGFRDKAKKYLEAGITKSPDDLDLAMAAMEYGMWVEDDMLQITAAKDFISLYSHYSKNPVASKQGRFVFSFRPEALAIAYVRLATAQLKDGCKALTGLMGILPQTPQPFRKGILADFEEELRKSNIPIRLTNQLENSIEEKDFTTMEL